MHVAGWRLDAAAQLFRDMVYAECVPDLIILRDQRMRKELDDKEGLQLLDDAQQNELQPNVITYNAVICAYEKGCMTRRALQVFDQIRGPC